MAHQKDYWCTMKQKQEFSISFSHYLEIEWFWLGRLSAEAKICKGNGCETLVEEFVPITVHAPFNSPNSYEKKGIVHTFNQQPSLYQTIYILLYIYTYIYIHTYNFLYTWKHRANFTDLLADLCKIVLHLISNMSWPPCCVSFNTANQSM